MASQIRTEKIEEMMDKTLRIIDDLTNHTMDECLHMVAAAVGVLILNQDDIQEREKILQELVRIIRTSVYDASDDGIVYVDKVIEE
tara:strand:+ start:134 stop:391 length:258 start_codon:yes stop_codon:yes gene_type:complete